MSKYRNIEISKYLIITACCILHFAFCICHSATAAEYIGRVVDEKGAPVSYATVYMADDPVIGTATGSNGLFRLDTDLPIFSELIVSFIGYEKQTLLLSELHCGEQSQSGNNCDTVTIVLKEQPIHLEEVVIAANPAKQKNKRRRMQDLLAAVYRQMQSDFPMTAAAYHIVSDVRMDAEDVPWGMEQMIAHVVVMPQQGHIAKDMRTGKKGTIPTDSIQFSGECCKRFFQSAIRNRADSILAGDDLEKMHPDMRRAANAVDSGVVVHRTLWSMGNIVYKVGNENEGETVLTYTEKRNILGIFIYEMQRHYILASDDLHVLRFAERAHLELNIPFGYKVKPNEMQFLNLLNMDERKIENYRIRKVHADISLNTLYQERNGHLYTLEKMHPDMRRAANAVDSGVVVHRTLWSMGNIVYQTRDVQPIPREQILRRVPRTIVPIY